MKCSHTLSNPSLHEKRWLPLKQKTPRGLGSKCGMTRVCLCLFSLTICLTSISSSAKSLEIPLKSGDWKSLSYRNIPAHEVEFISEPKDQVVITVQSSAGPLVHSLQRPCDISNLQLKGQVQSGRKKPETTDFDEDSLLRVGLVREGPRTLSFFERQLAAPWVLALYQLAQGRANGISKIEFYNITNRRDILGKRRSHPQSDLISESAAIYLDEQKNIDVQISPGSTSRGDNRVIGLWLSSDGDQTLSAFKISIDSIQLFCRED